MELRYNFTSEELRQKGFKEVTEDDSTYMEYIFNKDDYWSSKFLATTDIKSIEWILRSVKDWKVINPLAEEGEPFLNEQQIDEMISKGGF